ncbi:MAG: 50S ribosomal protein L11 methyltransferase [Alphaproteobacteria bacterium]|nr:50S ribosomal protein L11 methyltransferase [Alphaproteobacteria bacterium]
MNLSQLECPIDLLVADDLPSCLEEDAFSVSWYEKTPDQWALQVVFDPSYEVSIKETLKRFFKEKKIPFPSIKISPLPQENWVAAVYRDFPPLTIGRFYIYGSHIRDNLPKGLLPLCIDAATAFGSGQHESTEGCLKALSLLVDHHSFQCPLDMGCGSGILALAMASLWKVPVLACDNDPEAIRVTVENGKINHYEKYVEAYVSQGFEAIKDKTFDLITANILAGPLCHMAGDAVRSLVPGGYIVLAGLLNRQAEDVIDAYRSWGMKLVEQLFVGDWSTLIMRKESHE